MVRTRNKIVLLFTWTEDTPFIQASKVLHKLSESEQATPRVISIDSMSVGYEKAMSKIIWKHSSSEKHKIVIWGHPVKDPEEMSGSERLRKQIQAKKETKNNEAKELAASNAPRPQKASVRQQRTRKASTSKKITNDSPNSSPKPTKANLREVNPLVVMPVENPKDHMRNAFLEFAALI
ncbi:hypothetical protein EVAR_48122_1 [Eumeta japonica]|uniref:Uncharacterized protein n=1 Tax=Eumeta variegata TaxID=151549 RepID=A0A4C2ABB8_EUMVA|nr:hypothetical protein EVAR_48122_1 [Eumeta japonica]